MDSARSKTQQSILKTSHISRVSFASRMSGISKQDSDTYVSSLKHLESPWRTISFKRRVQAFLSILPDSLLVSLNCMVAATQFSLGYLVCIIIGNPALSIAYGVSISLEQIILVMFSNANEEALGISVGKFYGANNPAKAKQWLTNSLTTMVLLNILIFSTVIFFGKQILVFMGFDPELAANCQWMIMVQIPSMILLQINSGVFNYFISVETDVEWLSFLPVGVIAIFALTLALAYWTKLGFWSAIIGLTLFQVFDFILYIWIYFKIMDPKYRGLGSFRDSLSTLGDFLREFFVFWLGLLGEYLGWEIMVFIAVLTKNNDNIAAITYTANLAYYIFNIGIGQSYISRSAITALIGANKKEAARKFTGIYLVGLFLLGSLVACGVYFAAGYLSRFYTPHGTPLNRLVTMMFRLYAWWVPQDVLFFSMLTISRTIGLATLSITLNFIFVLCCQPLLAYWLHKRGHLNSFTILANTYSMFSICFLTLAIAFYLRNWKKVDCPEEVQTTAEPLLPQNLELSTQGPKSKTEQL